MTDPRITATLIPTPATCGWTAPAGRWVLTATVLGSGMAMLDGTVVNLALPRIGEDLDAGFSQLQWIVNGYTLSLAALILLGGSLGDRLGRRRIFVIGAVWFTIASVLCAARADLRAAHRRPGAPGDRRRPAHTRAAWRSSRRRSPRRDRPRAIGAWSGLGGVAAGIGPFLGGWLVDVATWRSIFLINVPVGIAVVIIATRHVPESRDTSSSGRLDVTRRRARRRRPRRDHVRPDGAGVADLRRRVPCSPSPSWSSSCAARSPMVPMQHLPVGPVQRHQRRDVPALRGVRRGAVPARPRAPGTARLLAAARRGGDRAADDHDAAVLGPRRSARPAHRPADPDDRRAAAVRLPGSPC